MKEIKHPVDAGTGNKLLKKRVGPSASGPHDTSGGKDLGPSAKNSKGSISYTGMDSGTAKAIKHS